MGVDHRNRTHPGLSGFLIALMRLNLNYPV